MSRVSISLVLIVTFVGFLLGHNLAAVVQNKTDSTDLVLEEQCNALREQYRDLSNTEVARELYKKAYSLSFDQHWQEADTASQCAALFFHGHKHWKVEAKNLIE